MDAASQRFEDDLTALIQRHGQWLTDNQVITVLERAVDEAYAICGEPEPSKLRLGMIAALKPFANLGVGSGPDEGVETYRIERSYIRAARRAVDS